jgi:heme exporter protein D
VTGLVVAFVLCWLAGYLTGRLRLEDRLVDWADDQLVTRPGRSPRFWLAVPIALVAVAALWTVHPRRTLANYRANKQARTARRSAAVALPQYDPGWADRRGGPTT